MNYVFGLFKYLIKGPFTNPVAFYIFGAGFLAVLNALSYLLRGDFLMTVLGYLMIRYLPPTSVEQVVRQVLIGTLAAGAKWFVKAPRM